jgi:hypothetical protein
LNIVGVFWEAWSRDWMEDFAKIEPFHAFNQYLGYTLSLAIEIQSLFQTPIISNEFCSYSMILEWQFLVYSAQNWNRLQFSKF